MTKNVAFSSCDGKHPTTAYVLRENIPNNICIEKFLPWAPSHRGSCKLGYLVRIQVSCVWTMVEKKKMPQLREMGAG